MAFDLSRNLTKKAIEPRHKLLKSHKKSKKCKGLYLLFTFPSCFIVNIFLKNNKLHLMAFTVLINSLNFMSLIFYCFIDFTIENYILLRKKLDTEKKKMLHSHIN